MQRRLPAHILKHTATPFVVVEGDTRTWIEGEPGDGPEPVEGTPFPCVLFLPVAGEAPDPELTWRPSRTIVRPTLMWNIAAVAADEPQPSQGTELVIEATDLAPFNGGARARWIVEGEPQPLGPPGRVFAVEAIVRRVSGP